MKFDLFDDFGLFFCDIELREGFSDKELIKKLIEKEYFTEYAACFLRVIYTYEYIGLYMKYNEVGGVRLVGKLKEKIELEWRAA